MTTFLNVIATEPEIARLPVMVDSSRWSVIEAGLKCVQGKGDRQLDQPEGGRGGVPRAGARASAGYGAAVVVMAFDEEGQADTVERKVGDLRARLRPAARRGLPPEDIIFDPNVLAVATGIEEHNAYAKEFIDVAAADQGGCPGVAHLGRRLESLLLVPRQRRRPRGDALGLPLPRDRCRARHGHRQRGPARGVRGHRARPARARRGRTFRPAAGRDRAPGRVRRRPSPARRRSARSTSPGASSRSRSGSRMRSSMGSPSSSRRTSRRRGKAPRVRWT